jgi:hypothetical protein
MDCVVAYIGMHASMHLLLKDVAPSKQFFAARCALIEIFSSGQGSLFIVAL